MKFKVLYEQTSSELLYETISMDSISGRSEVDMAEEWARKMINEHNRRSEDTTRRLISIEIIN